MEQPSWDGVTATGGGGHYMQELHAPQLLALLRQNPTLKAKGFSVSYTPAGEIVIDRSGHVRGIWDFDGMAYNWMSPCSSDPLFRTGNAKAAVLYTLVTLAQD